MSMAKAVSAATTRRPLVPRPAWAAIAVAAVFLGSFLVGRYPVPPHTVLAILAAKLVPIEPWWPREAETIVLAVRLPRIAAAMLVGAALSMSGAAYQGVFRNPIVSPDILGVSAGAGLGASLAILSGGAMIAVQCVAFAGGLAAVAVAHRIGTWRGRGDSGGGILMIVLAGVITARVFEAGISIIKYAADPNNTLPAITFWLMGGLSAVGNPELIAALPPCLVGAAILIGVRWRLNVASLGDEEARSLGVDAGRVRIWTVVAATLMTAAATATAGVVGLVGLVVPHLARSLVGPDHAVLLPVAALLGAAALPAVDAVARTLVAGEIPLGILTSLIGAPFFIAMLLKIHRGWSS
ncbi:FecCD family ABC transporter permease [Azospirillum argentinense]